jgi:hypothetical protein
MENTFSNDASNELFIGNRNLVDVIRQDTQELAGIGGSFDAIAGRMTQLVNKSESHMAAMHAKRKDIFRSHGYERDEIWDVPRQDRAGIESEIENLKYFPAMLVGEDKLQLVNILCTRGFQLCPFGGSNCRESSSRDYIVKNIQTNRELWINQMTVHLAKAHHLLEKDNHYGISAKEFYKEFM